MPNYDLYTEMELLEKHLVQDGETGLVAELKDAVSYGATGTEIFMHVRHILKEFIKTNGAMNPLAQRKVQEILEYLDKTLN